LTDAAGGRIPPAVSSDYARRLTEAQDGVARMLDRLLDAPPTGNRPPTPPRLREAMRYAALSGGKRLRPFVLIEAARLFGKTGDGVVRAAAALECVHCYSLVHDDLPSMDDDDTRRGQPTVHRAFGEATAILAGDALLTLAFAVLADPATDADAATRLALVAGLAEAAGQAGMVGGQMLDLAPPAETIDEAAVIRLQSMKTASLFSYAAEAGAVLGGASASERGMLSTYGEYLGRAFQLADDLIDVTATPKAAGKATGKDAAKGKPTLIAVHGVPKARKRLAALTGEAISALAPLAPRAVNLVELARHLAAAAA